MRCDEIEQLISDSLDGGQPLDGEIRRHISGCAACAAFERDCLDLDTFLTAGRMGAPAASAPRRRVRRLLVLGGLAAAAVMVLALLPFWRPRPTPDGPQHVQQPLPRIGLPQDFGHVVETIAVAPVRREMESLADDARSATRSLLACLPSLPSTPSTRSVQ